MARKHKGPLTVMRHCLPDFCWQTMPEVLTMLEQYDIDAPMDYYSVMATLSDGVRRGLVLRRKVQKISAPNGRLSSTSSQRTPRYEYRWNPEWRRN